MIINFYFLLTRKVDDIGKINDYFWFLYNQYNKLIKAEQNYFINDDKIQNWLNSDDRFQKSITNYQDLIKEKDYFSEIFYSFFRGELEPLDSRRTYIAYLNCLISFSRYIRNLFTTKS